jgi:protein ImuA
VGALLAWPGSATRPDVLRRLQLAAQAHEGPAFLFREVGARRQPSPAPLRLLLACTGPDQVAVQVFKRRGPMLAETLHLDLPPVLSPRALARARAPWPTPRQAVPVKIPVAPTPTLSGQAWWSHLAGLTGQTVD